MKTEQTTKGDPMVSFRMAPAEVTALNKLCPGRGERSTFLRGAVTAALKQAKAKRRRK